MAEKEGVKDKVKGFIKTFGTELALEFYQDDIAYAIEKFCEQFTPQSLIQLIKNSEPPDVPKEFFEMMAEHQSIIKEYNAEALAKIICELMFKVRPDLGEVLEALGDDSAAWMLHVTQMIRDRIVNPEKYIEEIEKLSSVKVTCSKCNETWRVPKESAEKMKMCPFCGDKKEKEPAEPDVS